MDFESEIAQTLIHLHILMLTHRWSINGIDGWLFFPHLFVSRWSLLCFFLYCLSCTNLPFFLTLYPHILCFFLPHIFPSFVINSSLSWLAVVPSLYSFFPSLLPLLCVFAHTTSTSFSFSLSLASFLLCTESYPADVEWHCEETGVFLHHWRHQQLRHAQQR